MNEFEDKLNSLLNDPKQMESFASFAKSIMGGEAPIAMNQEPDIDPALVKKIGVMMSRGDKLSDNEKRLLEAMKPYLSEKRRSKMDRAMKIARLASIAQIAASEFGGEEDV